MRIGWPGFEGGPAGTLRLAAALQGTLSRTTSWAGIRFICCREACVLVAYKDGTGKNPDGTTFQKWSIGFGSQFPLVMEGDRITLEQAFQRQAKHLADNDLILRKLIMVDQPQPVWDAVASLFYQAGTAPVRAIAPVLNAGHTVKAAKLFLNYDVHKVIIDGVETEEQLDGLTGRRIREMMLAVHSDYGDISRYRLFDGPPHETVPRLVEFPLQSEIPA